MCTTDRGQPQPCNQHQLGMSELDDMSAAPEQPVKICLAFKAFVDAGVRQDECSNCEKSGHDGYKQAKAQGLYAKSLNGDAFSDELKAQAIERIKEDMGGRESR